MHKLYMDFLDGQVNIYILYHGLQDNTRHSRHRSPRHKNLCIYDLIDRIVYLVDNLHCIDTRVCTIGLKIIICFIYCVYLKVNTIDLCIIYNISKYILSFYVVGFVYYRLYYSLSCCFVPSIFIFENILNGIVFRNHISIQM